MIGRLTLTQGTTTNGPDGHRVQPPPGLLPEPVELVSLLDSFAVLCRGRPLLPDWSWPPGASEAAPLPPEFGAATGGSRWSFAGRAMITRLDPAVRGKPCDLFALCRRPRRWCSSWCPKPACRDRRPAARRSRSGPLRRPESAQGGRSRRLRGRAKVLVQPTSWPRFGDWPAAGITRRTSGILL